jgi:hypothetical protein
MNLLIIYVIDWVSYISIIMNVSSELIHNLLNLTVIKSFVIVVIYHYFMLKALIFLLIIYHYLSFSYLLIQIYLNFY